MKTGVIKKTSGNNESDSDSEWFARFAEGLSTTMNKSRRISSSKSFHGTGLGERASERLPRLPSGRGGHRGGGLRHDSRSAGWGEPSRKSDNETEKNVTVQSIGSGTLRHQTLSSDFKNETEAGTISRSSFSKYSEKRKFSTDSDNETNARTLSDSLIETGLKRAKVTDAIGTFKVSCCSDRKPDKNINVPGGSTDVTPTGNRKLTSHADESSKHRTSLEMIVKRLTKTKSTSPAVKRAKERKRRISSHPTCDFCSRKFKKIKERDFHIDHHDEMMYRCPKPCGHEFILFQRLQQHSSYNHSVNLTKTDRAKCKITGRKAKGESNESDSQKSLTSLKKPRKDYRQKRKMFAVSTVRKQSKLNKKSANKNDIQKKKVDHDDVNETAPGSSDTPEQCFSLTTVKKEENEGTCDMSKTCPFKYCSFRFENDQTFRQHMREKHTSQLKIKRSSSSLTLLNQNQHVKAVKVEIMEPSMENKPMSGFVRENSPTKFNVDQGRTTAEQPNKLVSCNDQSTRKCIESSSDIESTNMTAVDNIVPTVGTSIANERSEKLSVERDLVTESPTKQHIGTSETINETFSAKLLAVKSNDESSIDKNDILEGSVDSKVNNKSAIVTEDGVTRMRSPADKATAPTTTTNTDVVDPSAGYSASLELLLNDFVGDETDISPMEPFIDCSVFMKIRESSTVQSSVKDDRKGVSDPPVLDNKMGAQPSLCYSNGSLGKEDAMAKNSVPKNVGSSPTEDEGIKHISTDIASDESRDDRKTAESPSIVCDIATLDQSRNSEAIPPLGDSITVQDSTKTDPFEDASALSMVSKMPIIDTVITMAPSVRGEEKLELTVNANVAVEPSDEKISWAHSPDFTEEQALTIDGPTVELFTSNNEPRLSDSNTPMNEWVNMDSEMQATVENRFLTIEDSTNKGTSIEPSATVNDEKESNMRDNTLRGLSTTTPLSLVSSNKSKLTEMHICGQSSSESSNIQKTTVEATNYLTSVLLEHSYFRPGMNDDEHQETLSLTSEKSQTTINACNKDKSKLLTGTVDMNSPSEQGVDQGAEEEVEVKSEPLTPDIQTIKSEPIDDADRHVGQGEAQQSFQCAINESFSTGDERFAERLSEKFLRWTIKDVAKETLTELKKNKRLKVTKSGKKTQDIDGSGDQTMNKIKIKQERNDEDVVSSPFSPRFVTSTPKPSPFGKSVIERKHRSRLSLRSGRKVNTNGKEKNTNVQKPVKCHSATDQDGFEKVVSPVRRFSASHPSTSLWPGNQETASSQTSLPEPAVPLEATNDASSVLASPSSPMARKRLLMSHGAERSVSPSSSRSSTPSPSLLSSSFSQSQEKVEKHDISRSLLLPSPPKRSQTVSPGKKTEKPGMQAEASDHKQAETDRTVERFLVTSTRSSSLSPSLTTQRSRSTTTCSSSDETLPGTTLGSTPAPSEMSSVNQRKSIHVSPPSCLSSQQHKYSSVKKSTASTSRSSPNHAASSIDMSLSGILTTLSTKLSLGQLEVNGKLKLTLSLKQLSPTKLQENVRDELYSQLYSLWSLLQNTDDSHSYMSSLPHQTIVPWEWLVSETDVTESQNTSFGKKQNATNVTCAKSEAPKNVTEDDSAIDETDEFLYSSFLTVFSKIDPEKKSLAKIEMMRILHNLHYDASLPPVGTVKNRRSISFSSTAAENTGTFEILNSRTIPCAVKSEAENSDAIFFRCMIIPALNRLDEEKKSLAQLEMHKMIHAVRFSEK